MTDTLEVKLGETTLGNVASAMYGFVSHQPVMTRCRDCEVWFETACVELPSRTILPPEFCDKCKPETKAAEEAKLARDEAWRQICPNKLFQDSGLVSYAPAPVHEAFRKWYQKERLSGKGIFATGPSGTFKTTFCWHALRLLHISGRSVRGYTANALADLILDSFANKTHGTLIQNLIQLDFLFIDDLDKVAVAGKTEAPPSFIKAFFEIVNGRYASKRPTLLTTNARGDTLPLIFGEHWAALRTRIDRTSTVIETGKLLAGYGESWNND